MQKLDEEGELRNQIAKLEKKADKLARDKDVGEEKDGGKKGKNGMGGKWILVRKP